MAENVGKTIRSAPTGAEGRQLYRPVAVVLGELTQIYNLLQENLCRLYGVISEPLPDPPKVIGHWDKAYARWHTLKNDYSQRELLRRAAESLEEETYKSEIIWLLDTIEEELRGLRNDAAHTPLVVQTMVALGLPSAVSAIAPSTFTKNPRALEMAKKDVLDELIFTLYLANSCNDRCLDLLQAKSIFVPTPLPLRPALPRRGEQKQRDYRTNLLAEFPSAFRTK